MIVPSLYIVQRIELARRARERHDASMWRLWRQCRPRRPSKESLSKHENPRARWSERALA